MKRNGLILGEKTILYIDLDFFLPQFVYRVKEMFRNYVSMCASVHTCLTISSAFMHPKALNGHISIPKYTVLFSCYVIFKRTPECENKGVERVNKF